ncbi:60S ribosomal protein L39-like [Talpa occidentalis]|uniref:60S ribosomal protein L39-like n=1 Tax=Talpa occidentalis TaxID=50954 RepID=UPI00188F2E3A|nr:60S ribosomal protein L39-like [Talpa occidentalis]
MRILKTVQAPSNSEVHEARIFRHDDQIHSRSFPPPSRCVACLFLALSSHKISRIKRFQAKKQKQNRPIPQWIWMKTDNKIRYNSKRRHWRRSKLGL